MPQQADDRFSVSRPLGNEAETRALGHEISLFVRPGDVICLYGDLGAGKTTLARGLIQALSASDCQTDVPSPTFTIVQPYQHLRTPVRHYDLYRISDPEELDEIGFLEDMETTVSIIEWPDHAGSELPENRIEVELAISGESRLATITGLHDCARLVNRMETVATFLENSRPRPVERSFLQGDASSRRYERLKIETGENRLLMDMPPDETARRSSSAAAYMQAAHLADGLKEVLAINQGLRDAGFHAPQAYRADLENGLLVLEDFGSVTFSSLADDSDTLFDAMRDAVELLARMAQMDWPDSVGVNGATHNISHYDNGALGVEVQLLLDWFWPLAKGSDPEPKVCEEFSEIWRNLFPVLETPNPIWVLRDFHSPNLLVLSGTKAWQRIGLIDTQDCVLGHPAYDLVSLLQDARRDIGDEFEEKLIATYINLREGIDAGFDPEGFKTAYAVLGAQRATKVLGIFARLAVRDGKPAYLQHIPRVSRALDKCLRHPELASLKLWFDTNMPPSVRETSG